MVYDCFQFFNELDILKLRMHVLNDVVDKFVISEATVTFSGEKKPLYFQENREMFKEFEDKIIHKVVDDTPMDTSAFMRDSHGNEHRGHGLLPQPESAGDECGRVFHRLCGTAHLCAAVLCAGKAELV